MRLRLDITVRQQARLRKTPKSIERMSFCLNDIGFPSNGAPTSCSAMCTAMELEPGAK
jgi:hypothetical protein